MKVKTILPLTCALLLLAAIPGLTLAQRVAAAGPNAEHREEGEQLLKALRDSARVYNAKHGKPPASLSDTNTAGELKGTYFTVNDKVCAVGEDSKKGALTAEPKDAVDGYPILVVTWATGDSEVKWYDTADARKKGHEDVKWGEDEEEDAESGDAPDASKQWDELYKAGASWVVKMDFGMAMWTKTEVVKVEDGKATIKTSTKFKETDAWPDAFESTADRPKKADPNAKPDPNYKEIAKGTEKVKDWDTNWTEFEYSGKKYKNWMSTKYGTIVKMEMDGKVTMELIELNAK